MNAPNPRRRAGSLGTQLIANALVSVLLPVGIASGIAFFFLSYHLDLIEANFSGAREALTRDIAGTDIRRQAENAATQIDSFLKERIQDAKTWAMDDLVVSAARDAHGRHAAVGLVNASIEEIEDRFRIHKSLGASPEADAWLKRQVAVSPHFAEVFFTDRNGFNVAFTNPTSDFVQSDEDWWQGAWSRGISIGEVEFDDSAGVWSIEISIRIDDPDVGEAVGVMKTVLGIEPIQQIADRTVATLPGGARMAVATGGGLLVAETSSGHARDRIMNTDLNFRARAEGRYSPLSVRSGRVSRWTTCGFWGSPVPGDGKPTLPSSRVSRVSTGSPSSRSRPPKCMSRSPSSTRSTTHSGIGATSSPSAWPGWL